MSVICDVPGVNSGGIPYPHQLGGRVNPDIADANISVVSLCCPTEICGLVAIGIDSAPVVPDVLEGMADCALAFVKAADGAVTSGAVG